MLDVALLIAMTTAFVSGYAISRSVLPVLGLAVRPDFVWRRLHDISANLTLLIVAVHVGLHWQWILSALRRYVAQPIARGARRIARRAQPHTVKEVSS